jgi:hypothetical protein
MFPCLVFISGKDIVHEYRTLFLMGAVLLSAAIWYGIIQALTNLLTAFG